MNSDHFSILNSFINFNLEKKNLQKLNMKNGKKSQIIGFFFGSNTKNEIDQFHTRPNK